MAPGVGRALRLARAQEPLVLGVAAIALAVAALLPLGALVLELASRETLAGAGTVLGSSRAWLLLARSLGLATGTTALAVAIGVPLGLLLGRCDVPLARPLLLVHAFPFFVPPFLVALGWFHVFGREGLLGSELTARLLASELGVIAILGLTFSPVVTGLVALALAGIDPSIEEAARAVARPTRVATRILLPLALPAAGLGALVVFALAISELGVPLFLRVEVYPSLVFARLGGFRSAPGAAFALVLPLLAIGIALVAIERWVVFPRAFAVLGHRISEKPRLPLGGIRGAATAVCIAVAVLSVAPLAALGMRARLTSALEWIGGSLGNSLAYAFAGALAIAALGLVLGHGLARARRAARLLDGLGVLAFLTPATALGVGLIAVWNRPATQAVYASAAIVIVGFVARYTVLGARTLAVGIAQSPPSLEEAAAASGAGYVQRLVGIVAPLQARALVGAFALALVFCLRDLETVVLFYPPGGETLTVRIFTLEANGPPAAVAGLAAIQVAATASILAMTGFVLSGRRAP